MIDYINQNIIGKEATFISPFGRRKIVYCDYIASGRSLSFIEDYLMQEVLPFYGNTHTTTTVTALQTTLYRHEARDIIRNAVNAGEHDAVIFTGSGCTGAVHKLIHALGNIQDVVVIAGPFEHHSNLLPWREVATEVITIGCDETGRSDLASLEAQLVLQQRLNRRIIGCFSVASNVTGVLEDDLSVTALLHQYGALAFWDYATAAPYVNIDMNPKLPEDVHGRCAKDAIYFSMHKFIGGVQGPGVLVAKKRLFASSSAPHSAGGGTVFFVTDTDHRYLQEVEVREEGGTPAIVEAIRSGLAMKTKLAVGPAAIMGREAAVRQRALAAWRHLDSLLILGPDSDSHLPVFSFLIRHPSTGLFLHYNFVVALLNDLFGIQSRGGCACAGPHQQRLLGLTEDLTRRYEAILMEDSRLDRVGLRRGHAEHSQWEVLRPGSTRLSLSWFATDEEIDFVIEAVALVAREGWKLLPVYRFKNETGDWYHATNTKFRDRRWLQHASFVGGRLSYVTPAAATVAAAVSAPADLSACSRLARQILVSSAQLAAKEVVPDQTSLFPPEAAQLRWFLTPWEAKCDLLGAAAVVQPPQGGHAAPFSPPRGGRVEYPVPGSLSGALHVTDKLRGILAARPSCPPWTESLQGNSIVNGDRHPQQQTVVGSQPRSHNGTLDLPHSQISQPVQATSQKGAGVASAAGGLFNGTTASSDDTVALPLPKTAAPVGEAVPELAQTLQGVLLLDGGSEEGGHQGSCETGLCILPGGTRDTPVPSLLPRSAEWKPPSKEIFKPFLEAVKEFQMVEDGDRVLVCLSGGKDSLSLLHTMRQYQFYAAKNGLHFRLGAVTVDPLSSAYDPRPLIPYLEQLGVEDYLFEQQDIMRMAQEAGASSICAYCSRMKRGRIYAAARRAGYNVLALGQHLDDLAESFFMSIFHNGRLRTMKANYLVTEGDLRIIRPLVYVREKHLRQFAESRKLPVIPENCPACFEAPKERHRLKQLLAQQELLYPRLYWNLKTALYPVMRVSRTGLESVLFGRSSHLADGTAAAVALQQEEEEDDGF